MLLGLIMATLALGLLFSGWLAPMPGKAQSGGGNPPPNNENTNCDNPTTSLGCAGSAQLVLKDVIISPAAATNAPYDCIVCVCDTVSANLSWFTVPSTNATQTCHTCNGSTPTNYCDPIIYTAGASPYNITNEWWNDWWWDWTNGYGDSVSFSFTNATAGWVDFGNISAEMTTNAPGCGVSVYWADNAHSWRSYAFVAVDSISCDTWNLVTNVPMPTYSVDFCPGTCITVTASPSPGMDDKFLPGGWSMSGGLTTTNSDGSTSRTRRLVDCGQIGTNVITATSGCSSKSLKVIVGAPYINIVDSSGNAVSGANGNNVAIVGQHINLTAQTGGSCCVFSNFQWGVPGYAIASFNPFTGVLVTDFPLTNSSVSFYWVDGGTKTVSCSAVCGGIACTTNVTISVTRPTASMFTNNTPEWVAHGMSPWRICIAFGDNPGVNDMAYSVLVNSPIPGWAETIQIIDGYSLNSEIMAAFALDTQVPYNNTPYIVSFTDLSYPEKALLPFDDGPAYGWPYIHASINALFKDYVMYCPKIYGTKFAPLGGDTIFVPLGKIDWTINGNAYYSGLFSITIDPKEHTGPNGPDGSTDFPSWGGTYAPQKPD